MVATGQPWARRAPHSWFYRRPDPRSIRVLSYSIVRTPPEQRQRALVEQGLEGEDGHEREQGKKMAWRTFHNTGNQESVPCPRKTDREKSISEYCTMYNQLLLYLYTQFCTDRYTLIEPFNIKGEWIIFTKASSKCKVIRGNTTPNHMQYSN